MGTDDYLSGAEDLRRRELVWGVVREPPSPFAPHQRVTTRVAALLDRHVREQDLGTVLVSPMDVVLDREKALVVQPDVMFISHARGSIIRDFVWGPPDLVVEISSASSLRYDRREKVGWYRAYGIREYWIVNPLQQLVTILDLTTDAPAVSLGPDEVMRSGVLPLFARTAGEVLDS